MSYDYESMTIEHIMNDITPIKTKQKKKIEAMDHG